MRKLIYSFQVSLDGYINKPDGGFGELTTDEEVHRFHNEQAREIGVQIYGRRLYETMRVWETLGDDPAANEVTREFAARGITLGYAQVDSWWYPKGANARWDDGLGGIFRYRAAPEVFPDELGGFQQQVGLPLVTHARWIDKASPLRSQYAISGNVITDPAYWDDTMRYLRASGVVTYEQDWLGDQAQPSTIAIVRHLVQSPRGRRIGGLLSGAADVVADAGGAVVATVTSAVVPSASQLAALEKTMGARYGRALRINLIIDPTIVGGLRVQIGDDVIDGSIASRLADLRITLAG